MATASMFITFHGSSRAISVWKRFQQQHVVRTFLQILLSNNDSIRKHSLAYGIDFPTSSIINSWERFYYENIKNRLNPVADSITANWICSAINKLFANKMKINTPNGLQAKKTQGINLNSSELLKDLFGLTTVKLLVCEVKMFASLI